jgi:hypothetical protein
MTTLNTKTQKHLIDTTIVKSILPHQLTTLNNFNNNFIPQLHPILSQTKSTDKLITKLKTPLHTLSNKLFSTNNVFNDLLIDDTDITNIVSSHPYYFLSPLSSYSPSSSYNSLLVLQIHLNQLKSTLTKKMGRVMTIDYLNELDYLIQIIDGVDYFINRLLILLEIDSTKTQSQPLTPNPLFKPINTLLSKNQSQYLNSFHNNLPYTPLTYKLIKKSI